jgi:hypothetical protein
MTPKRIQRKRSKGWRMPAGAVYVGRPSRWGNPFTLRQVEAIAPKSAQMWAVILHGRLLVRWDSRALAAADAVDRYRVWLRSSRVLYPDVYAALRGKDLACWCRLDQPCHADVLLEIANRP